MFYGFGRGFGQVVKQGLSSLAQSEPFVGRIKLERIRSGVWLRFATGEIQSYGTQGERWQGVSWNSHGICIRLVIKGC